MNFPALFTDPVILIQRECLSCFNIISYNNVSFPSFMIYELLLCIIIFFYCILYFLQKVIVNIFPQCVIVRDLCYCIRVHLYQMMAIEADKLKILNSVILMIAIYMVNRKHLSYINMAD